MKSRVLHELKGPVYSRTLYELKGLVQTQGPCMNSRTQTMGPWTGTLGSETMGGRYSVLFCASPALVCATLLRYFVLFLRYPCAILLPFLALFCAFLRKKNLMGNLACKQSSTGSQINADTSHSFSQSERYRCRAIQCCAVLKGVRTGASRLPLCSVR